MTSNDQEIDSLGVLGCEPVDGRLLDGDVVPTVVDLLVLDAEMIHVLGNQAGGGPTLLGVEFVGKAYVQDVLLIEPGTGVLEGQRDAVVVLPVEDCGMLDFHSEKP